MTVIGSKKKKVLIVSFSFPPTNNIAAVRAGKFAKYLPEFGWEPIVLTADNAEFGNQTLPLEINEANVFRTKSFSLGFSVYNRLGGEKQIPTQSTSGKLNWRKAIHRAIKLLQPVYTLPIIERLVKDPAGWFLSARKEGLKVIATRDIDVIFNSFPPPTAPFIASYLHKKTGIPWVAEFRDLWVDPYNARNRAYEIVERKLEKMVLRTASILVAETAPRAKILEQIHHKRVTLITNGFDEEDYVEKVPLTPKFTITYTGNIYPRKRDPSLLFRALSDLREESIISADDVQVRFFGGSTLKSFVPLIHEYHLQDIVSVYDKVPFEESIRRQKESTVLLLLEWNNPRAKGVYSGKIFEYLGARRPILATGYKTGIIDELFAETGTGVMANEVEMIKTILCHWLEEWRESGCICSHWNPVESAIQKYTRKEQTRRLAQMLDEVSRPHHTERT